jgi:arabinan endo-1,5-alpha-L-arabinosidase
VLVTAAAFGLSTPALGQQVTGAIGIHDPSSVIKDGSTYFLYGTGNGIYNKWSADGIAWNDEPTGVFLAPPAWTTQAVPGFGGFFWAPDIAYFGGKYHLYYSVSS